MKEEDGFMLVLMEYACIGLYESYPVVDNEFKLIP